MEIKASIPPFRIRFKKLCNSYIIKKAYIEEINKDRDKLATSSSSSPSPRNSTIRHLL